MAEVSGRGRPDASGRQPDGRNASPRRRAPGPRLLVLVALAVAAAIGAVAKYGVLNASSNGAPPPSSLDMLPAEPDGVRNFTTRVPARWNVVTTFPAQGAVDFMLTSESTMPPTASLPPAGMILIQIVDMTRAAALGTLGPDAESQPPLALLRYSRRPAGARDVTRPVAPHRTTLGGRGAAEQAYRYALGSTRDVQTELVSRRGSEIVSVEVDSEPSLAVRANAALRRIVAAWRWLTPVAPTYVGPSYSIATGSMTPGTLPSGQWLASGYVSGVNGNFADARLDQREIRAWWFTRECTGPGRCHTDIVAQLRSGGTDRATLTATESSHFWKATYPLENGRCVTAAQGPSSQQVASDTIDIAWRSASHRRLTAYESESVVGCADPEPANLTYSWVATRVPAPPTPAIATDAAHAPSAAAFRARAQRVCTRANAALATSQRAIAAADGALRPPASSAAAPRAAAHATALLAPLLARAASVFRQIPQPPPGPLDSLWRQEIAQNREQLVPAAAALAAHEALDRALSTYARTGSDYALQTSLAEAALYDDDISRLEGAGTQSALTEAALQLQAPCGIVSIFRAPTVH